MAYRGLGTVTVARRGASKTGVQYTDGIKCGRAIKVSIDPQYVDVSDYDDINEADEKQAFSYANITLDISELPKEAESLILGHVVSDDDVISSDMDQAQQVGFGIRVMEIVSGVKKYIAIWFHCVTFTESSSEHNTKKEDAQYDTSSISGKAVPDERGIWRTKKLFETCEKADSWLKTMAGIEE